MITSLPRPHHLLPPTVLLRKRQNHVLPDERTEAPLISTALSRPDSQRNCNLKNTGGQDCEKEIQVNTRKSCLRKRFCFSYRMALPELGRCCELEVGEGSCSHADLVDLAERESMHQNHMCQLTRAEEGKWDRVERRNRGITKV